MAVPIHPVVVAQIVARNLVPVAGVLFFGWSAATVLVLYFADTLLSMGVLFAALFNAFSPTDPEQGVAARINAEVGYVGGAALLCAFVAVPLGMPLLFVLAAGNASWRELIGDPSLQAGLLWQSAAALWSYLDLRRDLLAYTPDQLRLKRRFALLFLRWMVIVMVVYTGVALWLGRYGALLVVVVYAATTIFVEVAPDRFLRMMPGGAEDADPQAPPANRPASPRKTRRQ